MIFVRSSKNTCTVFIFFLLLSKNLKTKTMTTLIAKKVENANRNKMLANLLYGNLTKNIYLYSDEEGNEINELYDVQVDNTGIYLIPKHC